MPSVPTVVEARAYMSEQAQRFADETIQLAIDAERVAQAQAIRLPIDPVLPPSPTYLPADLKEALLRRVSRNLALRALPIGQQTGLDGGPGLRVSRVDPEIIRLEAPYSGPWVA